MARLLNAVTLAVGTEQIQNTAWIAPRFPRFLAVEVFSRQMDDTPSLRDHLIKHLQSATHTRQDYHLRYSPAKMPEKAKLNIDIPLTDVLTWLFPKDKQPSDKPIWIDAVHPEKKSLSPRQMEVWTKRLGVGLKKLGLQQNDVVMIHSTNHIFVPVVYLGVAGHGYIFSGCNPAYSASGTYRCRCPSSLKADRIHPEITYQINTTGAKVLLIDPTLLDVALEGASKANFPKDRIFLFSDDPCEPVKGLKDWHSILGSEEEAKSWRWRSMSSDEAINRTAVLNFSSGYVERL